MTQTPKKSEQSEQDLSGDAGEAEVQARSDEASEKGYIGEVPDETPNENYTLQGVNAGKPTPETERGKTAAPESGK
jgi:hypothetical protein